MRYRTLSITLLIILCLSTILGACQETPLSLFSETNQNYPMAEVLFEVTLPANVEVDTKIELEILDDVTGLAFNPTRIEMTRRDDRTFSLKTPVIVGSLLKYRYLKVNNDVAIEYNSKNSQVRFRLAQIDGPKVIKDIVAAWLDQPYSGPLGKIRGQLIDSSNNAPLPNILVTAEGVQTITSSDGSFILEGVTPGTHELVAYSLDGSYEVFEQGAVIADQSTTPVFIGLKKKELVNVKFVVQLPANMDANMPLRIATNMYPLGNAYSDEISGTTNVAANLLALTRNALGFYEINLSLPVGTDLRYKFTFGDGFWNAELTNQGFFNVRQLIVPDKDSTINCIVSSFLPPSAAPIVFNVSVPSETPSENTIDIQFKTFDWMGPIPLVRVDQTHWTYTLYNPQNYFNSISYRYCRNGNCNLAHDLSADGKDRQIVPSSQPQIITDDVTQWALFKAFQTPTTVVTETAQNTPRADFISGYETQANASIFDKPYFAGAFTAMSNTGAKWVVLTPTWTATQINLPMIEPIPGKDLLWNDLTDIAQSAQDNKLGVALYPIVDFGQPANKFWQKAQKDSGWWQSWFDRYHRFMIQNADLGNIIGASALFIGAPDLTPSMNGGTLSDGSSSESPENADQQWSQLIQDIRSRYSGPVVGVIALPSEKKSLPGWLKDVDAIYIQYSPTLSEDQSNPVEGYFNQIQEYLDNTMKPIQEKYGKPVIVGLSVASAANSYEGCKDINGSCDEITPSPGSVENVDLQTQKNIYNAAILAVSTRDWIKGFISRGYLVDVSLQDSSASVRGKPASDVLWYWYQYLAKSTK